MSVDTVALRLLIGGDSKGAQKALKDLGVTAKKETGALGKGLKVAQSAAAVGLAAIGGLVVKGVQSYEDLTAAVARLQRQSKISAEDASTLVGEWQRYGVSIDAGTRSTVMLSKAIDAVNTGAQGSGPAADAFHRLGISMAELKTQSPAQTLEEVRAKLAAMPPSAERTAIAAKLLGRGFEGLSKWLSASSSDMAGVDKALRDTGQVMSGPELAKAKQELKDQADLALKWRGVLVTVGKAAMPFASAFVGALSKVLTVLAPFASKLGYVAAGLAAFLAVTKIVKGIQTITTAFKGLRAAIQGVSAVSGVAKRVAAGVATTAEGTVVPAALGGGTAAAGEGAAAVGIAGSGVTVGAVAAAVVPIAAMLALAWYGQHRADVRRAAGEAVPQGGGPGYHPGQAGYQRAATAAAQDAQAAQKIVNDAIARLGAASATQTGKAFSETAKRITELRTLAAKPMILGNIDKAHTDGELRSTRDRIMSSLHITQTEADALMSTLFKDWRPQDTLVPKMNAAAAATEKRIELLRKRAGADIKLGKPDATALLNTLGAITSRFDGIRNAARQATNAMTAALAHRAGQSGGGHADKGGAGAGGYALGGIASGPLSGYLARLHGREAILPLGNPQRMAQVMQQAGLGGGVAVRSTEVHVHVHAEGANFIGTDRRAAQRLAEMVGPHVRQQIVATTATGF